MSLALALTINIVAMLALIGGLAYLMSRTKHLKPHRPFAAADLILVHHEQRERERLAEERIAA
jgi:hypothetical protein